jgi:hypothetical protein
VIWRDVLKLIETDGNVVDLQLPITSFVKSVWTFRRSTPGILGKRAGTPSGTNAPIAGRATFAF